MAHSISESNQSPTTKFNLLRHSNEQMMTDMGMKSVEDEEDSHSDITNEDIASDQIPAKPSLLRRVIQEVLQKYAVDAMEQENAVLLEMQMLNKKMRVLRDNLDGFLMSTNVNVQEYEAEEDAVRERFGEINSALKGIGRKQIEVRNRLQILYSLEECMKAKFSLETLHQKKSTVHLISSIIESTRSGLHRNQILVFGYVTRTQRECGINRELPQDVVQLICEFAVLEECFDISDFLTLSGNIKDNDDFEALPIYKRPKDDKSAESVSNKENESTEDTDADLNMVETFNSSGNSTMH